jgi:hypothetical protein
MRKEKGAQPLRIAAAHGRRDYSATMLNEWLDSRTPPPPARLAERLDAALADVAVSDAESISDLLTAAALAILRRLAADRGAESRAAAIDLLAADALITYALEAAAEDCESFAAQPTAIMARLAGLAITAPNDVEALT